jgi:hypothetical protein
MQHLLKRLSGAALFLVAAVLLSTQSCRKPEQEVGIDLQPEEDLLNVLVTDSFTIHSATIDEDSLRADELSLSLAGNYTDPVIGEVTASFSSHIRLATNNVNFGTPKYLRADSIILSLIYDGDVYGLSTPQEWGVYEVLEEFYVDSTYYTNKAINHSLQNLVKPGYEIQEINTEAWIPFGEDSLPPQLRLHLRESLAERFLDLSGSTELSNNTEFLNFFKGIHVKSLSDDAGVLRFNLLDPASRITMYYTDLTTGEAKTFNFNINSDCARINHFSFDYTGTEFEGVEETAIDNNILRGIQAGSGVKTSIVFPYLKELNQFDGRTINRAELILPVNEDALGDFTPQSLLFLLTKNEAGNFIAIPDQLEGPSHIGGLYDAVNKEYRFNIGRFVQELLNETLDSDTLYLVSNNSGVSITRVFVNSPDAYPDSPEKNMRLRITFSN